MDSAQAGPGGGAQGGAGGSRTARSSRRGRGGGGGSRHTPEPASKPQQEQGAAGPQRQVYGLPGGSQQGPGAARQGTARTGRGAPFQPAGPPPLATSGNAPRRSFSGSGSAGSSPISRLSDQDVLIELKKLVHQGNEAAQQAQAQFQRDNDVRSLLSSARVLLEAASSGATQVPPTSGQASRGTDPLPADGSARASSVGAGAPQPAKVGAVGDPRGKPMVGTADAADDATSAEGRNRRRRGGRKKGQDGPDEDTGLEAQVYENKENSTLAPLVSLKATGVADSSSFDTNPAASDAQDQTDGGKKAGRNSRRGRKAQGALNGHGSEAGTADDDADVSSPMTEVQSSGGFLGSSVLAAASLTNTGSLQTGVAGRVSPAMKGLTSGLNGLVLEVPMVDSLGTPVVTTPTGVTSSSKPVGASGRLAELLSSASSPFSIGLGVQVSDPVVSSPRGETSGLGGLLLGNHETQQSGAPQLNPSSPHGPMSGTGMPSEGVPPFLAHRAPQPEEGRGGPQPFPPSDQQGPPQMHDQQQHQPHLMGMPPHGFAGMSFGPHGQLLFGPPPHLQHMGPFGGPPQPPPQQGEQQQPQQQGPQQPQQQPDPQQQAFGAPGGPPPGPQQPQGGMFSPPQHPHQGPMGPMPPHMQQHPLMAFHPGMFMPRPPFMQGPMGMMGPPPNQQGPGGPQGPPPPFPFPPQQQHPQQGPPPPEPQDGQAQESQQPQEGPGPNHPMEQRQGPPQGYPPQGPGGMPPMFAFPPHMQPFMGWHPAMGMPRGPLPFPMHQGLPGGMPPGFQGHNGHMPPSPQHQQQEGQGNNGPFGGGQAPPQHRPEGNVEAQQQGGPGFGGHTMGIMMGIGVAEGLLSSQQKPQGADNSRSPARSPQQKPIADGGAPLQAGGAPEEEATDAGEKKEAANKPLPPKRTSKGQEGRLWVLGHDGHTEVSQVRPKADLMVRWELPRATLESMTQPELGLFRIGVASNMNSVISKSMSPMGNQASAFAKGAINFYAPRSAGIFVFRIFDAQDCVQTHGTSRAITVDVQDRDTEPALRFVLQQFREKRTSTPALSQLAFMLRALRPYAPGRQLTQLLSSAIICALKQVEPTAGPQDELSERNKSIIRAQAVQVLRSVFSNRFVISLLNEPLRMELKNTAVRYCPLTEELFASEEEKRAWYIKTWGYLPKALPITALPQPLLLQATQEVEAIFPGLLPSESFIERREELRNRLEIVISTKMDDILPKGTKLRVFGSSANNFGSDEADLDMCLTFPKGTSLVNLTSPVQSHGNGEMEQQSQGGLTPSVVIEGLAQQLTDMGMSDVNPRPTARIPIVLFRDPVTGLDCDISLENPLALRNTQLLKVYSRVDPRVRQLAYVVKYWARRRHINNASEGTLSSYAYILLILHFLQTRRPAIVPNLQQLPPDWGGQDADFGPIQSLLLPVMVQHPIDKVEVDTYFYVPPQGDFRVLQQFAARNKTPVGALLMEFFRYYAWDVDYREHVVSVRSGQLLRRDDKAEQDCWAANGRIAIEDPFETWYNVTHFLREAKHRQVRMEFARAYAMCCEEGQQVAAGGPLPIDLLARICEEAPEPVVAEEEHVNTAVEGQQQQQQQQQQGTEPQGEDVHSSVA